jgi:hypothetical protein
MLLALPSSVVYADTNVYLYDPSVASDIDVNAYQLNGQCRGHDGKVFFNVVSKGPAPAPFPNIAIAENSFEQLGWSKTSIDGVIFINHANYYKPGKKALILYIIRIPSASTRQAAEFEKDLTLSLFVDWDQNKNWEPNERSLAKSLNLAHLFPTTHGKITVYYLTSFSVPTEADITLMGGWHGRPDKDVRRMWSRALLAYDDPDMSPDGAQLFGEYEDYYLSYRTESRGHDD